MARGGKRDNAGRKPKYPAVGESRVIRVPEVYVDRIKKAIAEWEEEAKHY